MVSRHTFFLLPLAVACLCLFALPACKKGGDITRELSGNVVSKSTGLPLANDTLRLSSILNMSGPYKGEPYSKDFTTDQNGNFKVGFWAVKSAEVRIYYPKGNKSLWVGIAEGRKKSFETGTLYVE